MLVMLGYYYKFINIILFFFNLLYRSRDCLYLPLDRLRDPTQDRNHPLNAQLGSEIEKIERLLSRIDPDCTNRNECEGECKIWLVIKLPKI